MADSSILELPDNYTLHFVGKTTSLKLSPHSKIRLGENSKIVFDSSAKLIMNYATLTSKDSTKSWGGLFFKNTSQDTISNSKIINSKGGINFIDKIGTHTVIKDNEFINKTNEDLDGIYAYNSEKILIRGNHFYAQSTGAFNNAVYLEYCTSNDLNVLDNNIEDAVNGIVDIGSWSYIARNTLTGLSDSGCGITLDDYSGIVKHNVVTNYKSSVFSLLSAPYLYKNSFQLASNVNLDFESYSTPLLQPIESGVLKYWYGGDNIINISDDGVGVNLLENSYPLLKDGYNKFYLNAADYFISGEVPEEFEDSIEVRNNYWSTALTSGKFNISNTTVKYNPTEDGSPGNRPHNTTILMSIGFGLWDTINIHDAGDNSSPDLFLNASNKLIDGSYSEAIEDFKDIVEQKDSNFTNLSLKKIFHCYERSNFFNSNFSEAKSFFTGIFLDSNYNEISRSLANDLNLKVMLHNSEYTLVKEKYSSLYLNNTSNSLGFHALINKTILDNLSIVDTTDNLSSSAEFGDLNDHKKTMFALLNSNSVLNNRSEINTSALVKDYKLEQNYPNPFNPTTYIYYELPVSGMVSLKVYDLLGREMLSIVNEVKDAGKYKVAFDGSNFASGVYFYRIFSQNFVQTKRMVLIK